MGKRYARAPLVEALCEFRFAASSPWDLTIPGLVYEKVRDPFSEKRQTKVIEASLAGSPEGLEQRMTASERMQFYRPDQKALVQVGRHLLVINPLQPYPGWEAFLPLIEQGFRAYREVTGVASIARIGLRYINRIELPGRPHHLDDYFAFRPYAPATLMQDVASFIVGLELAFESGHDALRLQLASGVPEDPGATSLLLDLDYFTCQSSQVTADVVMAWLDTAHRHVEETFEACLEDRLRATFEEVVLSSGEE